MILGPSACICFDKEGYSFWDVDLKAVWRIATNTAFWRFFLGNVSLSLTEIYKDVDRARFFAEMERLTPGAIQPDMVEDAFTGVMAQVCLEDGPAAPDYIFERGCLGGTTLNLRNAPSPGATSSMALATELVNLAAEDFHWAEAGP
jgi:2-hydroxyglutarate dehydrogenase